MISSEMLPNENGVWAEIFAQTVLRCRSKGVKLLLLTDGGADKASRVTTGSAVLAAYLVDLGAKLSAHLRDFSPRQYAMETADFIRKLHPDTDLFLDHLEILFDPGIDVQPIAVLKTAARRHLVVANWPGEYVPEKNLLTFAMEGDVAYREYPLDSEITIVDASGLVVN